METKKASDRKKAVRRAALAARDALGEEERKAGSLLLTERILGHQWFYRAEDFLCFVSYGSEIDTREILSEALRRGKRVYVPMVLAEAGERWEDGGGQRPGKDAGQPGKDAGQPGKDVGQAGMEFFRIDSLNQLRKGYKGILEPSGASEKYVCTPERAERTLMLMPGAAFDCFRNRLGYGGGFYDRYLADREVLQQRTIAVGFKCQMVEEIPEESTDIRPCQIICV